MTERKKIEDVPMELPAYICDTIHVKTYHRITHNGKGFIETTCATVQDSVFIKVNAPCPEPPENYEHITREEFAEALSDAIQAQENVLILCEKELKVELVKEMEVTNG